MMKSDKEMINNLLSRRDKYNKQKRRALMTGSSLVAVLVLAIFVNPITLNKVAPKEVEPINSYNLPAEIYPMKDMDNEKDEYILYDLDQYSLSEILTNNTQDMTVTCLDNYENYTFYYCDKQFEILTGSDKENSMEFNLPNGHVESFVREEGWYIVFSMEADITLFNEFCSLLFH